MSLQSMGIGWMNALMGIVTGLVIFLPFYVLRILGAGDVKLLAAVGGFVGYPDILQVALLTGIAGGVLTMLIATYSGQLMQIATKFRQAMWLVFIRLMTGYKQHNFEKTTQVTQLPYALAISLGTLGYAILHVI